MPADVALSVARRRTARPAARLLAFVPRKPRRRDRPRVVIAHRLHRHFRRFPRPPYPDRAVSRLHAKLPPVWVEGGNRAFPLGTDALGRDMLSRIIYGARISLFIGLSVMVVSAVVGRRARPDGRLVRAASSMSSSCASWI